MKEIVKIHLENEMDLILASKRTMKLAELCSLSLTVQTALATAVSEIARCALSRGGNTFLKLGIITLSPNKKQISAVICDTVEECIELEAITFAKKLIAELNVVKKGDFVDIHLNQPLKFSGLITDAKIESFIEYFKTEPALSAYDEIRKKNLMLLEFSDKLKVSENHYRELAETLPIMMFTANPEGEVIYTNQWLNHYFGVTLKTITPLSGQALIHPEDYPTLSKAWETNFNSGNSFHSQGRVKQERTGTYLWHLISIVPVKDEQHQVTQWTGFLVDINAQKLVEETLKDNVELKDAQEKLVDYQKQLEEKISELNISNHELEQFAYIASHDLQEPLIKIGTFSNLLRERLPELDAESALYFSKIVASSKRMTDLINDVLDWSRIAKVKEEFSLIDLNVIVEGVKSDFESLIRQKHAVIQTSGLPVVKGVPLQMVQLFTNLISNSLKFSETAPLIKVASRALNKAEIGLNYGLDSSLDYTEITVSDNGIGFEMEYSDQIFKIFQRLNNRSEYKGTGIGLAICKKIVENHNGLISATGDPGHGATFTIILPSPLRNTDYAGREHTYSTPILS